MSIEELESFTVKGVSQSLLHACDLNDIEALKDIHRAYPDLLNEHCVLVAPPNRSRIEHKIPTLPVLNVRALSAEALDVLDWLSQFPGYPYPNILVLVDLVNYNSLASLRWLERKYPQMDKGDWASIATRADLSLMRYPTRVWLRAKCGDYWIAPL